MNPSLQMTRLDELKDQLAQVDELIRSGALKGKGAKRARDKLEAQMLAAVMAGGKGGAAQATADDARPSSRLVLGITVFVLAFGVLGYAWLGNFQGLAVGPGSTPVAQAAAGGAEHPMDQAQIEALTQRLAERLKSQPDDAEGWSMLGRSYAVLGRYGDAAAAFRKLIALRPNDAQAYADAADAVGMANGRKLEGEPEKLIAQALKIDPDNPKALGLAGTVAFDKGDHALAAKHWERALKQLEPGSPMAQQLTDAVNEARQRVGLPPLPAVAAAPEAGAAPQAPAAAGGAQVQARITLAPALAGKVSPDDVVFIFARSAQGGSGPQPPLAIQRRQVKDLPLDLTLDDSMAMSPAMSLSTQKQVVIGARISKSGSALPEPGDLQGLSPTVDVGAKGVKVEIADVVK
jgi:cytochrome c-type biogenesis protein CcmH